MQVSEAIVERMRQRKERAQQYLGDGVYASCDGLHVWLRVDRGDGIEEIALDASVMDALDGYRRRLQGMGSTRDMPEEL